MGDTGASGVVGFFFIVALFALTVIVGLLFLGALARVFGNGSKAIAFVTGLILIPCLFSSAPIAYALLQDVSRRRVADAISRPIAWAYMRDDVNSLIHAYYAQNPLSFTFPNNDEAASSPDLLQYLRTNEVFLRSGLSVDDRSLLSPFGDRLLLAIDRNNDGMIVTTSYVRSTPWTDKRYSCVLIRHTTTKEAKDTYAGWTRQN
jgi:hypothetical protein